MEDALYDRRSAAVLRYLKAGVPVDYVTPERETPPFVALGNLAAKRQLGESGQIDG